MSRTLKDKNPNYRRDDELFYQTRNEPQMKRRFLNFKKTGAPHDGDQCPECGGLTYQLSVSPYRGEECYQLSVSPYRGEECNIRTHYRGV